MVLASLELAKPIVLGLVQGAAFGLMAIGLVLIYKSSKVFNFAAGEFATMGALGTYWAKGFLPFGLAVIVGVAVGGMTGLLTERLVVRPLADRPRVTILVATAAVAITLIAVQFLAFHAQGRLFAARSIMAGHAFEVAGVFVLWQQLIIVLVLAAAGVALAAFFSRTDLGLATLASSQESTAARLVGVRLNRISMLTWGMAGALGGLAGVLLPPLTLNFSAAFGTTDLLIAAFTAAVLGGMTSVPGAFVGGLLVGLVQNMAQFNISGDTLPGAPAVALLAVLVAVLLVRPTGILGKEA